MKLLRHVRTVYKRWPYRATQPFEVRVYGHNAELGQWSSSVFRESVKSHRGDAALRRADFCVQLGSARLNIKFVYHNYNSNVVRTKPAVPSSS